MRMPLAALVVATAVAVAPAATSTAAAPKPQITDPAGDQVAVAGSGYDVVSALFGTAGTKTRVKRKTVYTPTKLVVSVTYAGAVPTDEHASQVIEFDAGGCENVYLQVFGGGASTYGSSDCTGEEDVAFTPTVRGNTLTFTVPLRTLNLKKGAPLTGLATFTTFADPAFGLEPSFVDPAATVDHAATEAAYRIA